VPGEHLTEELVSTDDGVQIVVTMSGSSGGAVDAGEVSPERLVGDMDEVERVWPTADGFRAHASTLAFSITPSTAMTISASTRATR
jgi:hypothetical protein